MRFGFIGLGRMGYNMVLNSIESDNEIIAFNRSPEKIDKVSLENNVTGAYSIKELISKLPEQKIVWLMVNAGEPVDNMISQLIPHLKPGDIIIDGGNSFFEDSQRRYAQLEKIGIEYLDVGTSGGMEGARHGACMMIGGKESVFKKVENLFKDMCVLKGYGYMGKSGAGHYVKAVHNGIEYGMMGAIAEGMSAIKSQKEIFGTDLNKAIEVYAHGSIISSSLVSWLEKSFKTEGYLEAISETVPKGETEEEMKKIGEIYPMPILKEAIKMRKDTRTDPKYEGKLLAAMRNQFGGHAVLKK